MRTEYPERYITLGLKIAYYRKKAGYTQEVYTFTDLLSEDFLGVPRFLSVVCYFQSKFLEDD